MVLIAAGIVIGETVPEPYIWYIFAALALVLIFLIVRMIVVLVRADAYD